MEFDSICQNCTQFFNHIDDMRDKNCMGVCVLEKEFEPFLDEIFEESDFSVCMPLYEKYRYSGFREACDKFEMVPLEDDEYSELDFKLQHTDMTPAIEILSDSNPQNVIKVINLLIHYTNLQNEGAFEGLLEYYRSLAPVEVVTQSHQRIAMLEALFRYSPRLEEVIRVAVYELERSTLNPTTRGLFSFILESLRNTHNPLAETLLLELVEKKKFGIKFRERIIETAFSVREEERYSWWDLF